MRLYIIGNEGITLCREAMTRCAAPLSLTALRAALRRVVPPLGTDSSQTHRWRKGDSNCRSRREGEAVPTRHMATIRANLQDVRSRR
jgi:hypothetical protein